MGLAYPTPPLTRAVGRARSLDYVARVPPRTQEFRLTDDRVRVLIARAALPLPWERRLCLSASKRLSAARVRRVDV